MTGSRVATIVLLSVLAGAGVPAAQSPDPSAPPSPLPSTSPSPSASPAPPPSPSVPPIPPGLRASVDRVVERVAKEHEDPCRRARAEGKPCFPVSTTQRAPEVTVRDTFRDLGPPSKPTPDRPPTVEEMREYRPGPATPPATLVTLDPGCVGRSVLRSLRGQSNTFYVYRIRDVHGDRVALYDHRLEASTFQGSLELVGQFDGECEALAAYRQERRRLPASPSPPPAR